jgi:hypothetical protein
MMQGILFLVTETGRLLTLLDIGWTGQSVMWPAATLQQENWNFNLII